MKELTMAKLESLKPGTVFATGIVRNHPDGVHMTHTNFNRKMLWVAKKGQANDWAIYIHWEESGEGYVLSNGDKVKDKTHIQRLVPCDETTLAAYRH